MQVSFAKMSFLSFPIRIFERLVRAGGSNGWRAGMLQELQSLGSAFSFKTKVKVLPAPNGA